MGIIYSIGRCVNQCENVLTTKVGAIPRLRKTQKKKFSQKGFILSIFVDFKSYRSFRKPGAISSEAVAFSLIVSLVVDQVIFVARFG